MSYSVVCIARVGGAAGPEVGADVAQRLGYRLVDEEIVQRAAASRGVAVEDLAEVEKRKGVLTRLLDGLAFSGGADGTMTGIAPVSAAIADPGSLRSLIQRSIHETADEGNVVIVSHAASFALTGRSDVLRVLVTASHDTRVARVRTEGDADGKQAAKAIAADDAGRAQYLKNFYGVSDELPSHYDLVLNSDRLEPSQMAALIAGLAG